MQKVIWSGLRKLSLTICKLEEKDNQVLDPKTNQIFSKHRSMEDVVHLNHHAVVAGTELPEGNSTRRVVEMIFRSSLFKEAGMKGLKVERVVKIHNNEATLGTFEEHRDMVKKKFGQKCGRCMADGNEIMKFHGTTISCSLDVASGVVKLCSLEACHVCNFLKNRCLAKDRRVVGLSRIYTTARSGMAHHSLLVHGEKDGFQGVHVKKCVLVCRMIAGHVHKPRLNGCQGHMGIEAKFDSGKTQEGDKNCTNEELEVFGFDPSAFLPCFLIVYSEVERN